MKPTELFAVEQPVLRSLPLHVPEIYALHTRRVGVEGYVCVHTNRYSVPTELIGRQVEVRASVERIRVFDGHRLVAEHAKGLHGQHRRYTRPEHAEGRWQRQRSRRPIPEEGALRTASPVLSALVDALRERHGGRAVRPVRRLHRIYLDYPTDTVVAAVEQALRFGLTDLGRIEKMVLRRVAGDFFRLPGVNADDTEDEHER